MTGIADFADEGLKLRTITQTVAGEAALERSAAALLEVFQAREQGFGFSPDVVVEYPDIDDEIASPLLLDPVGYVDSRVAELEAASEPITDIVLLTTAGGRLDAPLSAAGYRSTQIDMPAGPDFTWWFGLERPARGSRRTLYLEALDAADPKIRPSFALELRDAGDRLRGGACGAVHERKGERFAYLTTMTLDTGLAAGTGIKLGEALFALLRDEGVGTVHLGTQTAGPFYEKLGFRVIHRVLPRLRLRRTADGSVVATDLVMMERAL